MNNIDLLILDGPPAVGKSSLAKAIASALQKLNQRHAIIEMDDLARVYPRSLLSIMYQNLASIWPNYETLGHIKIIIPTYMQNGEREIIIDAAPANRITICEVVAPISELKQRIDEREQDKGVRKRLNDYLDNYQSNRTLEKYIDFTALNSNRPVNEVAQEIMKKLGW
jgi:adenylate kinase family enzyme